MPIALPTRRSALQGLALGALTLSVPALATETLPKVVVYKDPSCGCCQAWADHLIAAGFPVEVVTRADLRGLKAKLGVPADLASCHTAVVSGYVVEGHVPAAAIQQLLAQKPKATGLAVAGMPIGSPGMEGGEPEVYEVVLFGLDAPRSYGRFLGDKRL